MTPGSSAFLQPVVLAFMVALPGRLASALEGRYRVERQLGAGGMATVYLAQDVRHDRRVALKLLRPELAAVVGAGRFLAEIRTTANLQHPHILPLFDSGEAEGLVYYVMPYVEGESLEERLRRERQLPVEEAVRIARGPRANYDVTPDGQRFLMFAAGVDAPAEAPPDEIRIVVNWFEELRARVP